MQRITSQTSLQAAKVIQNASQLEDVQITVSWSGDVREANALERAIYGVIDFFDAGAPERRSNEAREAVKAKLTAEVSILAGPPSRVGSAALPNEMTEAINQVANNLINTGAITNKNLPSDLGDALQNIKKITAETDKKSRKLIWKAAAEQRDENKKVSIDAAKNIARNTKIWKESLHISTHDAFRLASNAWKLYEKKQILPEEGKEIFLCSGRLISRHGFDHEDALNYAIDLRAPLKTLSLGLDSVERVMKSLDYAIPELREQPARLRISAAIRYLQLQDTKYANLNAIDEIRRCLTDLPHLQQAMPKGCVIDQIHQGSHVRGLSKHVFPPKNPSISSIDNAPTAPEQALTNGANSQMFAKRLGSTREPVFGVSLPEVFANFNEQHVKDLVRGSRFEIRTDGKPNDAFREIEEKRRENPKKLNKEMYQTWANERIDWAGSAESAGLISHLESQSIFFDIQKFANEQFRNDQSYAMVTGGENNLARTHFVADKTTVANSTVFKLDLTNYRNETTLSAMPAGNLKSKKTLLPLAEIKVPLLPNPGPDKVAGPHGFSVKRTLQMELEPAPLTLQKACRIVEVSEEWDLLVDWDSWIKDRQQIEVL